MNCPKCGFEQPDGLIDCMRCGVIFSRLRGFSPAPAATAATAPAPPPPLSPPARAPRAPAAAPLAPLTDDAIIPLAPAAETLYDGPPPPPPPQQRMYGDPGGPVHRSHHTFDLGKVLSETFHIYFANLFAFLLLTGVAFAPVLFVAVAFTSAVSPQERAVAEGAIALIRLACTPLATAAVSFGVFQQMRSRDTTVLECLKVGLGSVLTVLFVALLQFLAIVVGFMLCIIPGFIFIAMYAVAVPAAVEERLGPFAAMRRSSELTDGYRGSVFGVLFLLGLLTNGTLFAIQVAGALWFAGIPGLQTLLQQVVGVVLSGLSATAAAVIYYRLRSAKESIDVESIASVFD